MSYGKLVVNADYFVRGSIINDPMALPVLLATKDGLYNGDVALLGTDVVAPSAPAFPS
jgi:hypothetical protein